MADRVASDHASVDSRRVHLTNVGRTGRLQIEVPAKLECEIDDVVSLSIEGNASHARVIVGLDGNPTLRTAFATRKLARTQDSASDKLQPWFEEANLRAGDPLCLDVLRSGYAYGLRRPGERVVYTPPEPPDSTLADIARDLETGKRQ